jgi:anti-sigma-K factor RskA
MTTEPEAEREGDWAAAEFALGVLDGQERTAAIRRVLAEPDFAAEVEHWRDHFGLLFAAWPEERAPDGLGDRLDAAIAVPAAPRRFWRPLALAASAVAAVLAGILVLRPAPLAPPAIPMHRAATAFVASLVPVRPQSVPIPAIYDPARRQIQVAAASLAGSGRSAELWLIPADGVPRSLGLLRAGTRTRVKLTSDIARLIGPRTALAVSDEPQGGSPSGKPTGAILASGSLIPV